MMQPEDVVGKVAPYVDPNKPPINMAEFEDLLKKVEDYRLLEEMSP